MFKILIIEDEVPAAEGLQKKLKKMGYPYAYTAFDDKEALLMYMEVKPDLAIVDINLGENAMKGYELVEKFNKTRKIPIVYISAYSDNKTKEKAKMTGPVSYLIKMENNEEQIQTALDMAINYFNKHNTEGVALYEKIGSVYTHRNAMQRVAFHEKTGIHIVDFGDIVYCKAIKDKTHVYLLHNKHPENPGNIVSVRHLGYYEEILNEKNGFIRSHDNCIVNMAYLTHYHHASRKLKMINNIILDASIPGGRRVNDFINNRFGLNNDEVFEQ
jgi:DNA-binding LytR/AlgR family response regulator